jgi:lipid-A-disaccharide synthase
MDNPLLFVSAGDPSGDNAVSRVISCLRQTRPDLRIFGLGGPRLKKLGQEQLAEPSSLAVLGFWEVAQKYLFFRKLFHDCVREIKKRRPKAILLVDYPGFNLRLAKAVRPLGIPIIYYISPQVWAWGKRRVGLIRQCVDRMLVILPFEEAFYREQGIAAQFVGHYLLEDVPQEYVGSSALGKNQIALLPGSRRQEVERMLPSMLEAARILNETHGTTAAVAALKGTYDYESNCGDYASSRISVVYDDPRRVIYESDYVLTASGTATLETGIIGRPMVVVYRTGTLTYLIARNLVKLDKIALVNLVLGEKVVPELIQNEASSSRMVEEIEKYMQNETYRMSATRSLARVPTLLGGPGASSRTAAVIGEYL